MRTPKHSGKGKPFQPGPKWLERALLNNRPHTYQHWQLKDIKMVTVLGKIFGAVVFFVLFSFLLSWPVMMLWNGCLVDAVEGVKEISWLQAWGIDFLCGLLFNKASSK